MNQGRLTRFDFALPSACLVGLLFCGMFCCESLQAQSRELLRGNMVPGRAGQIRLLGNAKLAQRLQPVKISAPQGSELAIVSGGSFVGTSDSAHTTGMRVGSLYRLRLATVAEQRHVELYPSVELLDVLHPPQGLENQFPIPVVIDASDVREAMAGRMVTKVIYLEDPETSMPHNAAPGRQATIDISGAQDAVRAAESLGRPMAILRIGSRVPTAEELATSDQNAFRSQIPETVDTSPRLDLKINPEYPSSIR